MASSNIARKESVISGDLADGSQDSPTEEGSSALATKPSVSSGQGLA